MKPTVLDDNSRIGHAEIDRDSLKALFHLFVGKPDSTIKIFQDPIELDREAINDLQERLRQKFRNHQVESSSACAFVSFSNNIRHEYSSIDEMVSTKFQDSLETREITLKWDFLLKVDGYKIPQRHILTVKIGRGPNPREALNLLLRGDDHTEDPYDLAFATMYCRADFINPILGLELIDLVDGWHKSLRRTKLIAASVIRMQLWREAIGGFVLYSFPVLTIVTTLSYLKYVFSTYSPLDAVTLAVLERTVSIFMTGILIFGATWILSKYLRNKTEDYLMRLRAVGAVFSFTNADKNLQLKNVQRNNRSIFRFIFATGWAVLLNLVAGGLAIYFGWS